MRKVRAIDFRGKNGFSSLKCLRTQYFFVQNVFFCQCVCQCDVSSVFFFCRCVHYFFYEKKRKNLG